MSLINTRIITGALYVLLVGRPRRGAIYCAPTGDAPTVEPVHDDPQLEHNHPAAGVDGRNPDAAVWHAYRDNRAAVIDLLRAYDIA